MDPAPLIFLGLSLMGFVFALAVGSLTGYHWWLACNNLTTLENLSYSGPSVLLDHAKSSGRAGPAMPSAWKPDHLLSRDQRNRLRREARGINVYDLGWRQNIKAVFGDRSPFLALWPMFRAYRK
jgi:palmitoyltransferase